MANPQLEDGHTKIAHEILDALMRVNFSPYERRVLDCVLRKTYGWNKKIDRISYTQFEEATGLNRWHVARALGHLITRNVIVVSGNSHKLEYGLQKDYDRWDTNNAVQKKKRKLVTAAGYILVYLGPQNPYRSMANGNGYVLEHRLVMAKHSKRLLSENEEVHHKDHTPNNNKIDNLEILTPSEHSKESMRWGKANTVTSRGNETLPVEVTPKENETLPPEEKMLPVPEKTLPVEVTKSLPDLVNTKARKHMTKAYDKSMGAQLPYFEKIRSEFSDIDDFDTQVKNCEAWHNEHHPKTASRHRLSALRNWLTKERKFRQERKKGGTDGGTGKHRQDTQRDAYEWQEAPEPDDTS